MEKIKFCPVCQKQVDINTKTCSCGYQFVEVEKKDEIIQTTNAKEIEDHVPAFLFKWLGFFVFPVGIVLKKKYKGVYPERSRASWAGAKAGMITIGVVLFFVIYFLIMNAFGKIA